MSNDRRAALQQEWQTLHNNCQQSESLGLVIKLVTLLVCVAGLVFALHPLLITLLILILWLQEAIWKTFQGRIEQRLLAIEAAYSDDAENQLLNLYSHWRDSRPGSAALLKEYLRNALRPTVAYPYVLLSGVVLISPCLLN